jgi:hypothetical protein
MMIKKFAVTMTAVATLAVPGVSMAADHPAGGPTAKASASSMERVLAGQSCREDVFEDRAEFRLKYGSGKGAMARCIALEIREARFECRQEAREDRFDFREDYGTGAAAQQRCVRDELS